VEVEVAALNFFDVLLCRGRIDALVYESVPFEEVPSALEKLGRRGTYGKLVATP
jgi:hypothetical protein